MPCLGQIICDFQQSSSMGIAQYLIAASDQDQQHIYFYCGVIGRGYAFAIAVEIVPAGNFQIGNKIINR